MDPHYNINQFNWDISLDYMPEKNHVAHFINGLVDSLEIHTPSRKRKRKSQSGDWYCFNGM